MQLSLLLLSLLLRFAVAAAIVGYTDVPAADCVDAAAEAVRKGTQHDDGATAMTVLLSLLMLSLLLRFVAAAAIVDYTDVPAADCVDAAAEAMRK